MGRELSLNAHVVELQMQWPATGSQNGVEQLDGRRKRVWPDACGGFGFDGEGSTDGQP
jgi:hypothetical protein